MSDHAWVQENLDAYVAGGLPTEEWERVEKHVAVCADCTQALTQCRQMERTMADLFADARPDGKLEDRMIRSLRKVSVPTRWPAWMRFAIGAAAVVMLGVVGAIVQAVAAGGSEQTAIPNLFTLLVPKSRSTNNLKQVGIANHVQADAVEKRRETFSIVDIDPRAVDFDSDIQYMNERIADVSVPGSKNPNEAIGIMDGEKFNLPALNLPAPGGFGSQGQGGALEDKRKVQESGHDQDKAEKMLGAKRGYGGEGKPLVGTFYGHSGATREYALPSGGGGIAEPSKMPATDSANAGGNSNGKLETKKKVFDLDVYSRTNTPTFQEGYFKSSTDLGRTPTVGAPESPGGGGPPKGTNPPQKKPEPKIDPKDVFNITAQPKQEPPPVDTGLKIIRTGEMEFEVDSFDNAVKAIMSLIKPLQAKGAFKLKEDSSKQANGKTRGHVVVRMKPENLDDFVLDLRRELGKMGDLRLQQIGSQDVTKQFTDTESELKAARAVEKRLLAIIENGKGDVKDLVAAEKELGTWRTKIEKMEGEIRYYSNQVALSTLTITLVEKEIQAAAALVVNGTVKMRLEVDNVSRAREAAEKAVEEFKGRIVKSDEKQYPAGQVEAIVHAEIPPANKDAFRKALEKLGLVSSHEDTQSQTTEGGTGPVLTPRRRINDILFQVTLNNIVNIKPRHSVKLDVVSPEVRSNFEKLKDEIVRVHKGQIRDAKLDENQDKQRVIAVVDFSVPTEKKADIDKLLASFGPTLDRVNTQAAITEISTEQKFGYQLTLYSIATVEPREKVRLHVAVIDVEKKASELADLVKEANGQVNKPKSGLNKQGQTEALLVISVPLAASDRLVREIKEKGKVIDWVQAPNPTVPANDLATAQIVVLLTGPNPIIPNDDGPAINVSRSLYLSYTVFMTCMLLILSGLSFILPWAVVIYASVWLVRRIWRKPVTTKAAVTTPTPEPPKP